MRKKEISRQYDYSPFKSKFHMKNYPKIGIRPTIDGRQGGVRESLEEKTMSLAKAVAELISSHVRYSDGTPVECVIADGTIGRVGEQPPVRPNSSAKA